MAAERWRAGEGDARLSRTRELREGGRPSTRLLTTSRSREVTSRAAASLLEGIGFLEL